MRMFFTIICTLFIGSLVTAQDQPFYSFNPHAPQSPEELLETLLGDEETRQIESLTALTFSCENGQTPEWLSIIPGNISVKLFIELDAPRTLRCVLNGNFHHNEYVEESGERTVNFYGVGLGNPDHVSTFSLWDGNIETHPGIAVDFIFPWIHGPELNIALDTIQNDTLVQWHINRGEFLGMPNGQNGIGGCSHHKLFLVEKLVRGGETLFTDTIELIESPGTVLYEFEAVYNGPIDNLCTETSLVRIDTGDGVPAFPPTEIPMGSLEEVCTLMGTVSTGGEEWDTNLVQVSPNPFTESFNVQGATGTYTVQTGTGALLQTGSLTGSTTNINGSALEKGLYILTITNPLGERMVKKLVCE